MITRIEIRKLITVTLLLAAFLSPFQSTFAQNANERDLQLPKPSDENLPSIYLIVDSTFRNGAGDWANGQWGWATNGIVNFLR